MAETVRVDRLSDLTEADRQELQVLSQAVYPPQEATDWSGRRIEWAPAEWCVRIHEDGALVSYVGITLRDAMRDGQPVRVGGIGGVKTHPAMRRRGLAERGMRRADQFFREQPGIAFAVLVCDARLLAYYTALGWREFAGRLVVRQHGAPADFTFNRVMTCGIRSEAPATGTIDLQGPPW